MILSVSRRTDIPHYYGEWFLNRLKEGCVYVRNPMNPRQVSRIELSERAVDFIVFWTKEPELLLSCPEKLRPYPYYVQFTLNAYGKEMEPGLSDADKRIALFQRLAERIGKERVIWRYDPILFSGDYDAEYHVRTFERIARALCGSTNRVVISFLDVYAKTKRNAAGLGIRRPRDKECAALAQRLAAIARSMGIQIQSCAERLDLSRQGVARGSCIDKERIEEILGCGLTVRTDRGQRKTCGCCESVDIGTYHTCPAGCGYCYANFSDERVRQSRSQYHVSSPFLCGSSRPGDQVTDRPARSLRDAQMSFLDGCQL